MTAGAMDTSHLIKSLFPVSQRDIAATLFYCIDVENVIYYLYELKKGECI